MQFDSKIGVLRQNLQSIFKQGRKYGLYVNGYVEYSSGKGRTVNAIVTFMRGNTKNITIVSLFSLIDWLETREKSVLKACYGRTRFTLDFICGTHIIYNRLQENVYDNRRERPKAE